MTARERRSARAMSLAFFVAAVPFVGIGIQLINSGDRAGESTSGSIALAIGLIVAGAVVALLGFAWRRFAKSSVAARRRESLWIACAVFGFGLAAILLLAILMDHLASRARFIPSGERAATTVMRGVALVFALVVACNAVGACRVAAKAARKEGRGKRVGARRGKRRRQDYPDVF